MIKNNIDNILKICEQRHSNQKFYGAAALNVHILRDNEILTLLLKDGVLEDIIANKKNYELTGETRSNADGKSVTLYSV